MKVLVCGSRSWHRWRIILDRLKKLPADSEIIHGDAHGADALASQAAAMLHLQQTRCPADWKTHGKRAGYLRNIAMLDLQPDLVIAFWDGESRGTQHTIDEAENRGIPVEILYEQGGNDWR